MKTIYFTRLLASQK